MIKVSHKLPLVQIFIAIILCATLYAQQPDPSLYKDLKWRSIGPFRAGRVSAVAGVPGNNAVFYIGTPGGGVWKTTDGGNTWFPISDSVPVASIGAVAVAPSNSNIIYMGTGEQTRGDGIYRSNDEGKTWTNIGLKKSHFITSIRVDPKNPDVVLVSVTGDQFTGEDRGIFKTTDAGKSWKKTFFKDNDTGVIDMHFDPQYSRVVYAATTWRPSAPPDPKMPIPPDSTIIRSTDSGNSWSIVTGNGLPKTGLGRVGIVTIPGTKGNGVYAIMNQGFFRSNDGGANWQQTTEDPRIVGNGYFSQIFTDPKNADIVYVGQTSMYRSTDGGKTFDAWYGAPSGDDIHLIWIDPTNSQSMLLGVDQGAIISMNGGKTWTSWYNQPTGQFYHVSTDNQFPYYVYASQQDSGTVGTISRSDFGEISYRDWAPVGGMEFAFFAPDPLDPRYVYVGGWYGSVIRFDRMTGQIVHVFVQTEKYRTGIMPPIYFSPQDPHTMYVGAQFVMKTTDGGDHWQEISPDLTVRPDSTNAPTTGRRPQNGIIYSMAVSKVKNGTMWVGTNNGLIQYSTDVNANGGNWQNVTPPDAPQRAQVNDIEASCHDANKAFAVYQAFRDYKPYIFRTRDAGKSWQLITSGIAPDRGARTVREDPVRPGLLFAGTENATYVSFDDGDHWQTLQQNLPTTPVTDMTIHGDDLVASTYGRSLWIMDDITLLRQLQPAALQADVTLLNPQGAVRVRWDMNQDTPLQQETPVGKNPPDGALIDYILKSPVSSEIKLAIYDSHKQLVNEFTSTPAKVEKMPANAPDYWFKDAEPLSRSAGHNRFVWDLRYHSPDILNYSYWGNHIDYIEYTYADHAIPGETPRVQPQGALVTPGEYLVVLTVDGKQYEQPLKVTLDPRIKVSQADLESQLAAEKNISRQMAADAAAFRQIEPLQKAIEVRVKSLGGFPAPSTTAAKDAPQDYPHKAVLDALKSLGEETDTIVDGNRAELGLGSQNRELARLAFMIESGDAKPPAALQDAVDHMCPLSAKKLAAWRELNANKLTVVNDLLKKENLQPLPVTSIIPADPVCNK